MALSRNIAAAALGIAVTAAAFYLHPGLRPTARAYAQSLPSHALPASKDGAVVVELCDGVTHSEVKGLKPGHWMPRTQALAVTRSLMAQWQRKHPDQPWIMAANDAAQTPGKQAANTNIAGPGATAATKLKSQQGDTYASFHQRDLKIWQAQTDAFVQYGNQVFHSAQLLGSTIGVSCDMCHPNAANTHPETYPKYQEQLQRVALLRDMIDWCIENPVKGATLDPNDPKMRALEAYIIAQRKGVPLDYGKH